MEVPQRCGGLGAEEGYRFLVVGIEVSAGLLLLDIYDADCVVLQSYWDYENCWAEETTREADARRAVLHRAPDGVPVIGHLARRPVDERHLAVILNGLNC